MPTPSGFADCSYELRHASVLRSAYITFGCDPTATDPSTVATLLNTAFAAAGSLKACFDTNVTLVNTRVSLGTDGAEDLVGIAGTAVLGTESMTSLPSNIAVLVHKRTTRGGRRGRGRFYLPWSLGTTDFGEDNTINTADRTRLQTALDTWFSAVNTGVGPLVVLHRPSAPEVDVPTTPGPPSVITALAVDPVVATQRRRIGR